MPRQAYFYSNAYLLAFNALTLIKDITVRPSNRSVDEKAKEVLALFFPKTLDKAKGTLAELFVVNVLDIYGSLPIVYKQQIEVVAKHDLVEIDDLLHHYHSLKFIEEHRTGRANPRDHGQKTILEFYNRTLKKRAALIDYLLFKLEDRAIEKAQDFRKRFPRSRRGKGDRKSLYDRFEREYVVSKDYPYRDMVFDFRKADYKYVINYERLDYRKINVVINKSLFVPIECDHSKGYSRQFYRAINKIKPGDIFKNLLGEVKEMPLLKGRLSVFKELRMLYDQGHWYGFYSLALPQIEGIFAEMVRVSNPFGKLKGALTDKVQQIRPFYESSEYSFDYYEFHLPFDRNHFSHTGKVDDVKTKCKILLLDLLAIVKIFGELDSPVIRVKNILKQGPGTITDIGKLSNLLHLVEQTTEQGLYNDIKNDCEEFIYEVLPKAIDFPAFIRNLDIDFTREFEEYAEQMSLFSGFNGTAVDIKQLRGPHLENKLKRIQEIHDKYTFMFFSENLKLMLDTHYIMSTFSNLFPKLDSNIKEGIASFEQAHKEEMAIIKILNKKLKVEIPDDFILMRKDLKHYLGPKKL